MKFEVLLKIVEYLKENHGLKKARIMTDCYSEHEDSIEFFWGGKKSCTIKTFKGVAVVWMENESGYELIEEIFFNDEGIVEVR